MAQKTALFVFAFALVMLTGVLLWRPSDRAGAGLSDGPTSCEKRSFEGSTETAGGGGLMLSVGLGELSDRSTRVASGTIQSFRTCLDPETREPVTSVTLDVSQHVKSPSRESAPSEITFDVPGGHIGNIVMAIGTMPQFTAGEQVVVFLQQSDDGRLRLTEDFQGKFSVEDGRVERAGQQLDAFIETVGKAVDGEPVDDPLAGGTAGVPYVTTGYKWYTSPIGYYLNATSNMPAGLDANAVEAAWNNAFNSWENDPKSDIDFVSQGNTGRTSDAEECSGFNPGDGYNDVTWGFSLPQGSSTLANTRSCALVFPGDPYYHLTDADIEFDNDMNLNGDDWRTDGTGNCGSGKHDIESVALHEIGHLLGLDHPGNQNCPGSQCPVMNSSYVGVKRTPCQDDANGMAALYPAGSPQPTATTANTPTNTGTPTATSTPTSPAATATSTSVPTNTATAIPSPAPSPTPAATNTSVPVATHTVAAPTSTPTRTTTRTSTRTPTPVPSGGDGDVNNDGQTNSIDSALILQYSAGLVGTLPNLAAGDVNESGEVNSIDSALVLQYSAGLLDSLPAGRSAGGWPRW